jgi:hypothetical protein
MEKLRHNQTVQFKILDIMPDRKAILKNQGIPQDLNIQSKIHTLITKAIEIFTTSAKPVGMISELSTGEFETIFTGQGKNEADNPLKHIFPLADNLALFALTIGSNISTKIEELFKDNDFALGYVLDTVASLAADRAVEVFEMYFFNNLSERCLTAPDTRVLSYSPGYCGWHISGQKNLFKHLQPETIGISLNDSHLMNPLKSVTGVLVAGKKEVHLFKSNYPFCRSCKTYSCHERMKRISIA